MSTAGLLPWGQITWHDAKAACARAGKRLCVPDEWNDACRGPDDEDYPYGDEYRDGYCMFSGVDGPYSPQPTGSYSLCEGGYPGLFDMLGNVEEWVDELSYREDTGELAGTRGGAFMHLANSSGCPKAFSISPLVEYEDIGFRCCKSP